MKYLVYTTTLFSPILFFTFNVINGREYEGADQSNDYIYFVFILDSISILIAILSILKRKKLNIQSLTALVSPVLILFLYYIENAHAEPLIRGFLAYSVPAFFIAIDLGSNKSISNLAKWIDITLIIASIGIILSARNIIIHSTISVGGTSYQVFSYMAGTAYSIAIFMIFFGKDFVNVRFAFTKTKIYAGLLIIFLISNATASLMSGGRGGFVLIIVSSIIIPSLWFRFYGGNPQFIIKFILGAVLLIIATLILFPDNIIPFIQKGSERTFSYISGSSIDLSKTSGRDLVYKGAVEYIIDRPLFGYGIFKYYDKLGYYPHNLFLELLLQGGIIYFTIAFLCMIFLLKKYILIIKKDFHQIIITIFILYPLVMLMFSGSYISTGLFIFFITYLYVYKLN